MINTVKNHISNNRGKYGAAAGIGAAYGASQIDTPLANQIKFNLMANGQNLAQDAASYTDGKLNTNLVNNLNSAGVRRIAPEQMDAINQGYNGNKGTGFPGADAKDAVNIAEFNSIPLKDRIISNDDTDAARMDYLNSGMNLIKKGFNHVTESTGVICIPVKQMLLEGTTPEEIIEGAIGKFWKAKADNAEMKALNAKLNYKDNLGQYLLNPFVDGPLKQLGNKITSLLYQALMKIFFTGEKITSIEILEKKVKALGNTPFSRQMGVLVEEIKLMPEINKKIKDEHFIQWLINPLVPGPKDYFKYKKQLESTK